MRINYLEYYIIFPQNIRLSYALVKIYKYHRIFCENYRNIIYAFLKIMEYFNQFIKDIQISQKFFFLNIRKIRNSLLNLFLFSALSFYITNFAVSIGIPQQWISTSAIFRQPCMAWQQLANKMADGKMEN